MGVNDQPMDFMRPKTVSIRRKVRTTQILPKPNELEVKARTTKTSGCSSPGDALLLVRPAAPINPFRRAIKRPRDDQTNDENGGGGGEVDADAQLPEPKKDSATQAREGKLVHITFSLPRAAAADPDAASASGSLTSAAAAAAELPPPVMARALRYMPIDWCLKSKVRFSSPKQLPWTGLLKTTEEASGTTGCVRALVDQQNDTSAQARFHQSCLYWQHPSLPWVPLFPRHGHHRRFEGTQLVDSRFHDALQLDFRQSFKSLYQLVRARQCPFFYVCGPEFTVLFRATGTSGLSDIHALVAPTTKGFRNTLRERGVEFQMPLRSRRESDVGCGVPNGTSGTGGTNGGVGSGSSANGGTNADHAVSDGADGEVGATPGAVDGAPTPPRPSPPAPEDVDAKKSTHKVDHGRHGDGDSNDKDGEDDEDDDDNDFFQSLGLSQQDFPTVAADKLRKRSAFDTDSGPSSCVVAMGEGAQALFNHLLNTDLSISVGSQAGIPPTLLAPVAFHGATLRSLKLRQTWFRNQDGQRLHAVEMVGPVMPHAIDSISALLATTQERFSMLTTPTAGLTAFSRTINQVHRSGSKNATATTTNTGNNNAVSNNTNSSNNISTNGNHVSNNSSKNTTATTTTTNNGSSTADETAVADAAVTDTNYVCLNGGRTSTNSADPEANAQDVQANGVCENGATAAADAADRTTNAQPEFGDRNDTTTQDTTTGVGFGAPVAFAVEALKDCGLPKCFVKRMCATSEDQGTIIEAEFRDSRFYVNTCA